jgi:hypothetical protein
MDTTEPPYEYHNFRESETLEMPGEQIAFIKLKSEKVPRGPLRETWRAAGRATRLQVY